MSARLLIVDDEPRILESLVRLFESEGFAVETAHDGAAAEVQLAGGDFDGVLLDVALPGDRVPGPQDVEPLPPRGGPNEHPGDRPQAAQVRPVDEVGGVHEQDVPPPGHRPVIRYRGGEKFVV